MINFELLHMCKLSDKDFMQYFQSIHENLLNKQEFRRDSLLMNDVNHQSIAHK